MSSTDGWSNARARVQSARDRWRIIAASRPGRFLIRLVRTLFLIAILVYLVWTLGELGWAEVLANLPTQPLFYVLFLALYFLLPVAEVVMYRLTWTFDALRSFPAFLKKRVYNREVMGYSGEVYFFSWARREIGGPETRLLETIRDNNILSSVSSTLVVVILLTVFLFAGELRLGELIGEDWAAYLVGGTLLTAGLIPLGYRYRRFLFSMPARTALLILGLQSLRLLVGQVLQIGQWAVVMPEVPLQVWFTYAALSLIVTRIPFLPNQNLVFMGAGIELSHAVDISTASIAGMLLVTNVLDKVLNLALFGLATFMDRQSGSESADHAAESETPYRGAKRPDEV